MEKMNETLSEEAKAKVEEAARAAANIPAEKNAAFVSVTLAFENGLQIGRMLQEDKPAI